MKTLLLVVVCVALTACRSEEPRDTPQIGTAERETRDSVIGQSQLPGAKAVEGARDISATARERAAALDSIQ